MKEGRGGTSVTFPHSIFFWLFLASIAVCFLLTISSAYDYGGTRSDDIIYFGYNDTCNLGSGGLLIIRVDKDENILQKVSQGFKKGQMIRISGGRGNDYIQFVSNDARCGVYFDDHSKMNIWGVTILGGPGNDCLRGWGNRCYIFGEEGNDCIYGGYGNDYIDGGPNNDFLLGGEGDDNLYGGDNNDVLVGGIGIDNITGGSGSDTYRCRNAANPQELYDGHSTTDCGDTIEGDVEYRDSKDPYREWAGLTFNANGINYHMLTTSNPALLLNDRSSGAKILMNGYEPLHVTHKQYGSTCGPSSLNPVLEYFGISDRSRRLKLIYDLEHEDMTLQAPGDSRMADVGYFGSTEHIMYLGYRINPAESRKKTPAKNPDYFIRTVTSVNGQTHHFLNLSTYRTDSLSFYDIQYEMNRRGGVQSWAKYGAPVGGDELPKVANDYFPPIKKAKFVNIGSIRQLKDAVREFIDHGVPTVLAVENGGHFNTLIGYWEKGDEFYIYTADPLDGYGREFTNKPMRWVKMKVTQNTIDSGEIKQILDFDHPALTMRLQKLENGGIYNFKCLGHIEGNRWLDGRTQDSTVGLVPATSGGYTGTRWQVIKVG